MPYEKTIMKPEEKARQDIDRLLVSAGWSIQDYPKMNLEASLGIAVREFPTSKGEADYLLFVNKKAVGVLEAKPQGTTLSGVAEQTIKYVSGIPSNIPVFQTPIPYAYESTGIETYFRDLKDPWLRTSRYESDWEGPPIKIMAETTLSEFIRIIESAGGSVYLKGT